MTQVPNIRAINVSKVFNTFYDRPHNFKSYLVELIKGSAGFGKVQRQSILKNISFDIYPGEFVGIMGGNGVGKSTLLKLISGIYVCTTGKIEVHGQIAPLIELGAGFHPELSGYENIFLNASILGFGRKQVTSALPKIVEFSELGEKIYTPVKHFSSGMLARLGFAVATHLPAPILLIDEILAVGDEGFQQKCLDKVRSLHQEGRTLILISHDSKAVRENCSRCIVLGTEGVVFDGSALEGTDAYKALFLSSQTP